MIVLNAKLAKHLADNEHVAILESMHVDATIDMVLDSFDDAMTPEEMALNIRQIRAFWNAQANMAQSFKTQADDWRKVVEGLRAELDGLRPE